VKKIDAERNLKESKGKDIVGDFSIWAGEGDSLGRRTATDGVLIHRKEPERK